MKIGKFGVAYLGFVESSLLVEDCTIGETTSGGVFLSEFAHNVMIRNNTFENTIGVYGIFLNMYAELIPNVERQHGYKNNTACLSAFLTEFSIRGADI